MVGSVRSARHKQNGMKKATLEDIMAQKVSDYEEKLIKAKRKAHTFLVSRNKQQLYVCVSFREARKMLEYIIIVV